MTFPGGGGGAGDGCGAGEPKGSDERALESEGGAGETDKLSKSPSISFGTDDCGVVVLGPNKSTPPLE